MSGKEKFHALLFDAAARISGGRKPLPKRVEKSQPPITRSLLYNDSFYFNFFDVETDIGGFTWIGKLPNMELITSVQVVYGLGDDVLVKFGAEPYPAHNNNLDCGGVRYERIEPLKKWRITTSGAMMPVNDPGADCEPEGFFAAEGNGAFVDVSLDLEFNAIGPANNSKDYCSVFLARQMKEKNFGLKDFSGIRKIAANHYEQSGLCKGLLTIGGKEIKINATGHRDHSWGIRDWHRPKGWTWLSVQFGTDVALNLCRIMVDNIDLFMGPV